MSVELFIAELQRLHQTGQTTEHSFRPALAKLFDSVDPAVLCINEPPAITKVGRPDFVLTRRVGKTPITVGHCEAKDIGMSIDPRSMSESNKAQHARYVKALPNLIYTNGLDFAFYRNGEKVREIKIGEPLGIRPLPENFEALVNQLRDSCAQRLQTITSSETLAEMMAGKAVLIKDILFQTLREDKNLTSELAGQLLVFREQLIHDLSLEDFADIYAETIAYGMFAARLHDQTLETFTREEALRLLPKSNPFLRKLFEFVAGPGLPDALRKTVDELAEVFQATDLVRLFENFGQFTQRNDPFIHFYETFLTKYNPAKRKARGVWYTPEPVVNFIVRVVDDVLKTEFGLAQGLADTSKITVDWDTGQTRMNKDGTLSKRGTRQIEKKEVHRVQILDPAAGTGTFLAEVIRQIGERVQDVAPGQWSAYVEKELIPRLHGFELLMASYAMCHMKLDMMLTSMGYKPTSEHPPRLSVYLTNSLEEGEHVTQTLPFAQWLSNEAREANTVKNDVPVMVVLGNPPYSGVSQNMGDWIVNLIEDYKYIDGTHFGERKHWLHDDYVKFIRFAEHMIDKNGEGVLGFITNHGYIDNLTFRGMRWRLLQSFDKLWILDLHGNSKKMEVSPDGSPDENVFDIQTGVSLIIAVKKRKHAASSDHKPNFHFGELWGSREQKYETLLTGGLTPLVSTKLSPEPPHYLFTPRVQSRSEEIGDDFQLTEFLREYRSGIVTMGDGFAIASSPAELTERIEHLIDFDQDESIFKQAYGLGKNYPAWILSNRAALAVERPTPCQISYRIFDVRWTAFNGHILWRRREELMKHVLLGANICLVTCRQSAVKSWEHVFVSNNIVDDNLISNRTKERAYAFPLYLYDDLDQSRRVNMDPAIRARIEEAATGADGEVPDEVAIFDYIYGVLHCPAYRETYLEFLRTDFPRIPYPPSPEVFWGVSRKGTELRRLHLMEDEAIGDTHYPFEGGGDSVIAKPSRQDGSVFINNVQSFRNVSEVAWNFRIGGYQPAQKWLNDRKGSRLAFNDVLHYQKIVKILTETDRIMRSIEMPL